MSCKILYTDYKECYSSTITSVPEYDQYLMTSNSKEIGSGINLLAVHHTYMTQLGWATHIPPHCYPMQKKKGTHVAMPSTMKPALADCGNKYA
jgi:hypothetical protein